MTVQFEKEGLPYKFFVKLGYDSDNRQTIATMVCEEGPETLRRYVVTAVARAHPTYDTFTRARGRAIALGRCLRLLGLSEPEKQAFWNVWYNDLKVKRP